MGRLYLKYEDGDATTVKSVNFGEFVVWDELVRDYEEFIRGIGYVIPYNFSLKFVCDHCGLEHQDHALNTTSCTTQGMGNDESDS